MTLKEKRSPEIIREYFELLRLRKKDNGKELSNDFINSNESLRLIVRAIKEVEDLISSCKSSISISESKLLDVVAKTEQLSNQVSTIKKEMADIKKEILKIQVEIHRLSSYSVEEIGSIEAAPKLEARKRFILLLSEIRKDLDWLSSSIINLTKITNFKRNSQFLSIFSIAIFGGFILVFIFQSIRSRLKFITANLGLILFVFYLVYLYQKLESIDERYELEWKQQLKSFLVTQKQRSNDKQKNSFQQQSQQLEERLKVTRNQYKLSEVHRNKFITYGQQIENLIASELQKIFELEKNKQQKEKEYQEKIDELRIQEQIKKENRLEDLEYMIKTWLSSDVERLTKKFMKKLKIYPMEYVYERNVLKSEPIRLLIGTTLRTSESVVVESDSDQNLEKYSQEIYIQEEDFKSELTLDGKSKVYGVYEFLVIFLCSNFLCYHKCYWNFIRGKTVGEETCEYLYDSIVSVKTQEKSSIRLKNEKQKNIYEKRLFLSSKDGKVVCFRITQHKIDRTHSVKLSKMDNAVVAIRDMLRQRRIDVTLTKDVDE